MLFTTQDEATKFAEQNVLDKKFENIVNKNKVIGFQIIPFGGWYVLVRSSNAR